MSSNGYNNSLHPDHPSSAENLGRRDRENAMKTLGLRVGVASYYGPNQQSIAASAELQKVADDYSRQERSKTDDPRIPQLMNIFSKLSNCHQDALIAMAVVLMRIPKESK